MTKLTNEVVHISVTVWARAKRRTVQSSPQGKDCEKCNAKSTCACVKETTFFTISTSWWTLNCSPFSSSSHGDWDMHHFICQFCHTDCMLKVLKLTQSQLARVRKKQHFSQSLPCGELWTVLRLALAHTVTEICTTSFVNFVILIVCWRC